MSDRPAKGIHYLSMGPWPGFIGLVFDEKAYLAEIKRLKVTSGIPMLPRERADAALHEFVSDRGSLVWLLAVGPVKGKSKEMVAGLVAHEATHLIQNMREEFGDLGCEAEAYLVQMVVQETLQRLWKSNRVRAKTPGS